jgi:tetratricopeptide (TPR) repeat protein
MTHTSTTIPARKRTLSEIQRQSKTSAFVVPHSERARLGRAHYDRAQVRASEGDVRGAALAYETAVRFAPDFAEAYSNLGNLYLQSGRRDDALRAFATAIRAKPDLAPVYCNLAAVLIDLGRCDEAIAASETALRLAPDLCEAYVNLYQAFRRSGRHREALASALRATQLRPDRDAYMTLGAAALNLDAFDVAFDAFQRALELDATCAEAHCNLGALYHLTGGYTEAIAACETAITLRPDFVEPHKNLALSLLIRGDFARGWDEYIWMWRFLARGVPYPYLDRLPLWNGEPFAERSLLITLDQGFGDAIQMVRYLPAVKARGGRVILEVRAALGSLFADLPSVDELRVHSDVVILADDVDLQVPILGLPRALATDLGSIPAPIPYLRAQPERIERWRSRLESPARLRVGIVWAGNPDFAYSGRRACGLDDFAALSEIDGVAWFGLQKGRDEERRSCGSFTLDPLGAEIGDFADTAAILTHLDLVIATDTAIVHLAGAMGRPVWTLLAFVPDWRWLLGRDDSPWYPTMRLFRQPTAGDWASVFRAVARELRAL